MREDVREETNGLVGRAGGEEGAGRVEGDGPGGVGVAGEGVLELEEWHCWEMGNLGEEADTGRFGCSTFWAT